MRAYNLWLELVMFQCVNSSWITLHLRITKAIIESRLYELHRKQGSLLLVWIIDKTNKSRSIISLLRFVSSILLLKIKICTWQFTYEVAVYIPTFIVIFLIWLRYTSFLYDVCYIEIRLLYLLFLKYLICGIIKCLGEKWNMEDGIKKFMVWYII